jgi:hypothetical protein
MVEVFDSRIAPVLKSAKLMSDSDIGNIKLQARKIYEADAKDYNIPKDKKTMRALDFVQGAIAGRIASEATPQPQGESNAAY